jgi:hypothetical protein
MLQREAERCDRSRDVQHQGLVFAAVSEVLAHRLGQAFAVSAQKLDRPAQPVFAGFQRNPAFRQKRPALAFETFPHGTPGNILRVVLVHFPDGIFGVKLLTGAAFIKPSSFRRKIAELCASC